MNSRHKLLKFGSTSFAALLAVMSMTACGSGTHGDSGAVSPKGTISLDGLKVGVPETVIEEAVLTFVKDDKPQAKDGGKSQYLSRSKDSNGGQYIVQCKDGSAFLLQSYYVDAPIDREAAMITVSNMLPSSAPPQSKVDDSALQSEKGQPKEKVFFGPDYMAELVYVDKSSGKVQIVNVYDTSKMRKAMDSSDNKEEATK